MHLLETGRQTSVRGVSKQERSCCSAQCHDRCCTQGRQLQKWRGSAPGGGKGICCTRGPGRFVQARKRGNARAIAQRIIVPLGTVKVCASTRDRRRGLPAHSGRQAASPSPTQCLAVPAGGCARPEWCTAREAPRQPGLM